MRKSDPTYQAGPPLELSAREQAILRLVVKSFVQTAGPVGSRFLARNFPLGLSAASIRNTMSDLEEQGYLDHPYTSAGRVPTELGYRTFVNQLMESPELSAHEKRMLQEELDRLVGQTERLLHQSTRILGQLSNLLGVVLSPQMATGVLERLDVMPLSSSRAMFIISVEGGFVRTIIGEIESDMQRSDLDAVVALLNERLAGLTLQEIRETYDERTRDIDDRNTGLVDVIHQTSALLFSEEQDLQRLKLSSTQNILRQPEFQQPEPLRNLMALLENEEAMVQLLEEPLNVAVDRLGTATVSIGHEPPGAKNVRYSVVAAQYQVGTMRGTVGVLGPTRMDYRRAVALVEGMAALLSDAGTPP